MILSLSGNLGWAPWMSPEVGEGDFGTLVLVVGVLDQHGLDSQVDIVPS